MTQPLGYYCALTPGDGTYLDWLQDTYGSCLEGINRIEKLHFLKAITENLIATEIATQGQYLLVRISPIQFRSFKRICISTPQ
ncbi:hypothetical protein HCG51_34545 (plasmid) [Tolypothrix sp. PCC 7910]|uniref:hypothetical protein n=1 Tax=Tolypothrix sp. PCC 7910 TaxID=2099387 RepID=UPI001427877D|nr:hypothetical protein [Tolypothrix sp. PCC 7910]QIR41810.1 hypothetical protein HCG51_34545 [Tolypothrix sp. PCC 7910]